MTKRSLTIAFIFFSVQSISQQTNYKAQEIALPILPITVKNIVTPPTPAQATDRLLWYKGKKVDDSTLITPQATLVRWSKQRDIVIVQPKKDPFIKMATELVNTQKRKDQFYAKIAERKTSVMMYPAIVATFQEFDAIARKYGNVIKNTIDLPPALTTTAFQLTKFRTGGTASVMFIPQTGIPAYIKKAYQDVMASMKNYPPIDFPAPPATDFGYCLNYCDSIARKTKDSLEMVWLEEFTKYEAGIKRMSIAIVKQIEILGQRDDPEAEVIVAGLGKAVEFADARIKNKVDLLIRKYGKDFTRLPSVTRAAISFERQRQLMGIGTEEGSGTIKNFFSMFDAFDKYMDEKMDAKNYNVAFNFPLIISMERQRQLLGSDENDNKLPDCIDKFWAFNRFKIDVELDFNSVDEHDCGVNTDKVVAKTEMPQYLSVAPLNCKFMLIQNEQHIAQDSYHGFGIGSILHLKTGAGKRVDKETDPKDPDKCITINTPYSNLPLRIGLPFTKMTFCEKPGWDTLFVSQLEMDGVNEKKGPSGIYGYYGNEWYTDDNIYDDPYAAEENEVENIMEKYVFEKSRSSVPLSLAEAQIFQQAMEKIDIIKMAKGQNEKELRHYFTFKAKNGDPIIIEGEKMIVAIDEVYKDQSGYERKSTTNFKVKVVHDPLPYKTVARNR